MSKMGRKNKDSKEANIKKMRQQLAALERKNGNRPVKVSTTKILRRLFICII